MASLSVSDAATDTVADTTPNPKDNKNQSPTEPPLVVATKGVSDLRPVGEGWFLVKLEKKKKKKKNRNRKRKAEEPPSKEAEEKGKGDPSAVPPIRRSARVRKRKRVQCSFPDVEGSHSVPQTGPSQSRGRGHVVGGGTHIPSHSSEPGIYNLLGAPVTAGATLVVQPSSSVSVQTPLPSHSSEPGISNVPAAPVTAGAASLVQPSSSVSVQTPLPKPAQVLPPLQLPPRPPCKTYCEICQIECPTPQRLEEHKNGRKHQKIMRGHEILQRWYNTINAQQSGQIPTSLLNLTDQPMELSKPVQTVYFTCELCDRKFESQVSYQHHVTGRKHLSRLTMTSCELCNIKGITQDNYKEHIIGKKHLARLRRRSDLQALAERGRKARSRGKFLGLQTLYPPDIIALSNAINAQVQQGDNNPQLLFAQLMMTVLSKTQAPATAPVTDAMAAQIPAPTSKAGPSYEPQLLQPQTQVSEITAHVKTEIPTGETKSELLPVPLGSNTQPGLSVSTQIEGGGSETKTTGVKFPQDNSGVIPAANSGTANY